MDIPQESPELYEMMISEMQAELEILTQQRDDLYRISIFHPQGKEMVAMSRAAYENARLNIIRIMDNIFEKAQNIKTTKT